ncbi:MAG: S8 family peptidase [Planctomycetota bacterium]|jgi:subtilisin family serine protease
MNTNSLIRRAAAAIIAALPVVTAGPVAAAPGPFHYVNAGESKPLTLDSSRVAVLRADGFEMGDLAAALVHVGVPKANLTAHAISGWALVDVPADRRSEAGVREIVADLVVEPVVGFVSPVFFDLHGGPLIVTPDLLVRFKPDVAADLSEQILRAVAAGTIVNRNWSKMPGAYRVRSLSRDGLTVLGTANLLAALPEVKWAEPDMIFSGRSSFIPNDTLFDNLWGLHNTGQTGGTSDIDMDAPEAWDITTGCAAIHVVIIDTGVQLDHPDLNVQAGTDTTSDASTDGSPVNECDDHGTWVAGCVSAIINNNLGVVGVSPDCVSRPARTFISNIPCTGNWSSNASWTVDSLDWAQDNGVRVSNNSNSYGFTSNAIEDKYEETRNNGMVHFASAGNDSDTTINYPASIATVNAVAAIDHDGNLASFSDSGPGLAFSGPGDDILTTDRTGADGGSAGDYAAVDGTSFASPYAAGVAALVLSSEPPLTAQQVEDIMAGTATDLGAAGYDTTFGWGLVNAHEALLATEGAFLDIKPGSCPNSFNRKSNGVLPVALVGTECFDVMDVNLASVYLMRADGIGGAVAPHEGPPGPHSVFADAATPFVGETCECAEAEGDGITDLSMKFKSNAVVAELELNDLPPGDLVELILIGEFLDGTPFAARDCIRLVPPGMPPGMLAVEPNAPGVFIDVTPLDEQLDGGGFGTFDRTYPLGTVVTLTAPPTYQGWTLAGWKVGPMGFAQDGGSPIIPGEAITITVDADYYWARPVYQYTHITNLPIGFGFQQP